MADQTTSTSLEPWLQGPYQNLVNWAQTQAATPWQAYGGQGVAPLTQQQLQAISGVGGFSAMPFMEQYMNMTNQAGNANTAGAAVPYNTAASNHFGAAIANLQGAGAAPTALGASNWYTQGALRAMENAGPISGQSAVSPYAQGAAGIGQQPGGLAAANPYLQAGSQAAAGGIGSYMNPYQSSVMDEIARRGGQNLSENLLPAVNKTFTNAGQFGSSRNADFTNRAIRDTQREVLGAQSQAGQQGFNTALSASQNDLARQLQAGQTAGNLRGQDLATALQGQLGAGNLSLQGANTDINKWMNVAGQQANLANMQGQFANTDANRWLNIANQQQSLGNSQAGLGNMIAGQQNVDATRLLGASGQGANQAIGAQNVYNNNIDRLFGYGGAQQAQNQQENAWNYNQWQQQQQYPWQQMNNLSSILGGARPGGTVQSTSGGGGNSLSPLLGAGLGLIAARPWTWFADGGEIPGYAGGGVLDDLTTGLDRLADAFDSPLMAAALAMMSDEKSLGSTIGDAMKAAGSASDRQGNKRLRALQEQYYKKPASPMGILSDVSAIPRQSAGGSGIMQGARPYWDEYEAVGYADGGTVDDEDEGGILSAFTKAGDWLDRITGGSPIQSGPLDERYAKLVGGNLPERPAVNMPLLQMAGQLMASRNPRAVGAIGEALQVGANASENQRKLALGEQMLKAQILGSLQKENDLSKRYKEVNGQWFDLQSPGGPAPVGKQIRPMAAAPFGLNEGPEGIVSDPMALKALSDLKGVETGAALDEYMKKAGIDAKMKPALEAAIESAKNPALIARSTANAQAEAAAKAPYTAIPVPPGGAAVMPFAGMGGGAPQGAQPPASQGAPVPQGAVAGAQPPAPGAPPAYTREPLPGGGMVMRESSGLGQASQTKLEESAIDTSNQISRLDAINKSFKPEYLQVLPKVGLTWSALKEKGGVGLGDNERVALEDFTKFRRDTVANLNKTIQEITGAAMSEGEAKRITAQVPNAGQGILDGDSPTEFKAKLDAATQAAQNALLRTNWARSRGINPLRTGVELDDVPKLVNERGRQLNEEIRKADPSMTNDARRAEVKRRLGVEFGLVR